MFLQTSFLVFSSVVHTRLTSADPNTDIEKASNAIDIASFIFIFLYSKGCAAGGGPIGFEPKAGGAYANAGVGAPKLPVGAPPNPGLPKLLGWLLTLTVPWLGGT